MASILPLMPVALAAFAFAPAADAPELQKQTSIVAPAPVAVTYDPQEGPFVVRLNSQNEVGDEQLGVIKNAVRSWSGDSLQAFHICASQNDNVTWKQYRAAIMIVARELKLNGARVVTMPDGGHCRALNTSLPSGPHIEINGVVNL